MVDFSLSPSKIGVMKDCPRCFYDANVLKLERPRGIFPSLPGGVDRVMKTCFDMDRSVMPIHLRETLPGRRLYGTTEQINKLRNWRSGLKVNRVIKDKSIQLIGALDDLVIEADGTFSPLDTKTKGDAPKNNGAEYYQHQLDLYALMLGENGMRPSGNGYLDYWYPASFLSGSIQWKNVTYTLSISQSSGELWLQKAVEVLTGSRPMRTASCEYCRFVSAHEAQTNNKGV